MWIDLDGAANVRDVGGLPTTDGKRTQYGKLLRSDNLQGLTAADIDRLVGEMRLRDVVDLRTHAEVKLEGPGPLVAVPSVTIHHLSVLAEAGEHTDVTAIDREVVLPWKGRSRRKEVADRAAGFYLHYLHDRPDSIVSAMRVLARSDGAAVVHCAAGKDRTGVVTAMALDAVGVERSAIVSDYVLTGQRVEQIVARLKASPTYADDLNGTPADAHVPRAETMRVLLGYIDDEFDGTLGWLRMYGWTDDDTATLRARLVDGNPRE